MKDVSAHIAELVHYYNTVSMFAEDIAEALNYEVIDWGEDWEDYGKYQLSHMILLHKEQEFYLEIIRGRTGDHWSGYEFGDISQGDVTEVEPQEVKVIKYVKKVNYFKDGGALE